MALSAESLDTGEVTTGVGGVPVRLFTSRADGRGGEDREIHQKREIINIYSPFGE